MGVRHAAFCDPATLCLMPTSAPDVPWPPLCALPVLTQRPQTKQGAQGAAGRT